MHVRLFRRTYSTDVRVLSTYVLYQRTCATNVRVLPTYVFYRRTYPIDIRASTTYVFGTTRLEIEIRDYAVENRGFGTTQTTLDLVEEDRRQLVSGLRLATKITLTLVIYLCDV